MRQSAVYYIWEKEVDCRHRGGIAIMWQRKKGWQLEEVTNYGPNVVSCMLTTGWKWWYVVGVYILTNDHPSVQWVEQALESCAAQTDILLVG